MKKVNKTVVKNLDPAEWVNINTGEMLTQEPGEKIVLQKIIESDEFIVNSQDYITIDVDSIKKLQGRVAYSDLGALISICEILSARLNILMKESGIPHSITSVSEKLSVTHEGARKLLARLVDRGVLAYVVSVKSGFKQKVYMANPYLVRKGKHFSKDLKVIFDDMNKKYIQPPVDFKE